MPMTRSERIAELRSYGWSYQRIAKRFGLLAKDVRNRIYLFNNAAQTAARERRRRERLKRENPERWRELQYRKKLRQSGVEIGNGKAHDHA